MTQSAPFNPRYPASNFPNAVDEINVTPAELADSIMAVQASLMSGGTPPSGVVGASGTTSLGVGNGTLAGPKLWGGSGAPATGLGAVGDFYFRSDTPGTANQRIYTKTAAAVWTGIL